MPSEPAEKNESLRETIEAKRERRIDHAATLLEVAVGWAETVVALVLAIVIVCTVVLVIGATIELIRDLFGAGAREQVSALIKTVLDTFIIIELFRITIAYVRHHEVIHTVLETALVVAAREIVVIEAGANEPLAAAAVGGTLLAVGVTWYLLRRGISLVGDEEQHD